MWHSRPMRPTILTDDVLSEIDVQADLDAVDREPTDAAITRDVYREMWPRAEPKPTWDAWVNLP